MQRPTARSSGMTDREERGTDSKYIQPMRCTTDDRAQADMARAKAGRHERRSTVAHTAEMTQPKDLRGGGGGGRRHSGARASAPPGHT
eukprot:scaffold1621_cov111-Isochrysis_galbana.AAC.3